MPWNTLHAYFMTLWVMGGFFVGAFIGVGAAMCYWASGFALYILATVDAIRENENE